VRTSETNRMARQKKRHIFAIAVTLLGMFVFLQAVHAKSSHYFPKTTQARYSAESVKIAKPGHTVLHAPVATPVLRGATPLARPEPAWNLESSEIPCEKLSEQISYCSLRSPPVTL
jgi:hypothetical protein